MQDWACATVCSTHTPFPVPTAAAAISNVHRVLTVSWTLHTGILTGSLVTDVMPFKAVQGVEVQLRSGLDHTAAPLFSSF